MRQLLLGTRDVDHKLLVRTANLLLQKKEASPSQLNSLRFLLRSEGVPPRGKGLLQQAGWKSFKTRSETWTRN